MSDIMKIRKIRINPWYKLSIVLLMVAVITPGLPKGIRQPYLIVKMIICVFLLLWGVHRQSLRKSIRAVMPILPFAALIVVSAIYNHSYISVKLQSIAMMLLYIDLYLIIGKFLRRYDIDILCLLLFRILIIYVFINDITVLMIPAGTGVRFFVGTKFMVSYTHWLFCGLLLYLEKKRCGTYTSWLCIIAFVESAFIIMKSECSTGLVGLLMIALVGVFSDLKIVERIMVAHNAPIILAISVLAFVGLEAIINIPIVSSFIVNVLGENLTLTGRLKIYQALGFVVRQSPWLGYGYENRAVAEVVGYGNAQNGLFELLVNYGLITVIAFVYAVTCSCRRTKEFEISILPFVSVLFALIIASIVEISFNNYFIFALAVIFSSQTTRIEKAF